MSNPGVLTLSQKLISGNKAFRVEDNLGESIHFHYNDIRIDLTIQELLKIADICEKSIYDIVHIKGFHLDDYQDEFINSLSDKLTKLVKVEKIQVKANMFVCIKKNRFGIPVKRAIRKCSEYKKVETDDKYLPVVFNNDNVVQYGFDKIYRALSNDQNALVTIIRLSFEGSKFSESKHPTRDYFFKWNKIRIKKTIKRVFSKLK